MKNYFHILISILLLLNGCRQGQEKNVHSLFNSDISNVVSSKDSILKKYEYITGSLEKNIIKAGLINIKDMDSTLLVDLKYSSMDNFLGADVYGTLENCYLQKDVAEKLVLAQLFLKTKFPYYSLIVYDGVRPRSVQKIMWEIIQVPAADKTKYLSGPLYGSLHNYGAAIDLSIVDEQGNSLDMGTKYDYFGELAYPTKEEQLFSEGKLTAKQITNRKLLRSIMEQAGFSTIETEWWHFNSCSRNVAMQKYEVIE